MSAAFICVHCHQEKSVDPRQKDKQRYCGENACQRARKSAWQREKAATNPAYQARQKACQERWRQSRPLHQYQQNYREAHPEYVERNREQQRVRNHKRRAQRVQRVQPDLAKKIVKMDALLATAIPAGTYEIRPYKMDASQKIVKMDALIVQIQTISALNHPHPP